HIADVAHYVPWNSSLDLDARRRATSVYLVDRVIPMLPDELSGDLCSLKPDEVRRTMTADLYLDDRARLVAYDLYPALIRSHARLSYEEAQALLDRCHPERSAEGAESKDASRAPGLLIVDELGRLEIWRGGGLTSAMALLAQGPTAVFPHALAVVRDYLLDDAEILLAEAWPDHCRISPDDTGRAVILSACEFGA
ncbi:ribonuclease catalytic domain-containing protein, partial [Ellagibacter isourolithinifaciens]|uniref:ribonuclease catalytic domain-containing protein n=1 Tax=Ellagibacter isourolithinifaciens TaxID=2137581 RepID=UPI002E77FE23